MGLWDTADHLTITAYIRRSGGVSAGKCSGESLVCVEKHRESAALWRNQFMLESLEFRLSSESWVYESLFSRLQKTPIKKTVSIVSASGGAQKPSQSCRKITKVFWVFWVPVDQVSFYFIWTCRLFEILKSPYHDM